MRSTPRPPGAPYTAREAAAALRLAESTVRKLIRAKRLRSYREGPRGGKVLVPEEALRAYLRARAGAALDPPARRVATTDHFLDFDRKADTR